MFVMLQEQINGELRSLLELEQYKIEIDNLKEAIDEMGDSL